jgi:alpha-tubulin suppressor-like RCC1 family protein
MVLSDGTVRCWGQNGDRELGTSSSSDASTPTQVQSITTAKTVVVGSTQTLALLANGSVMTWGKRASDYDYTTFAISYTTSTTPTAISGLGGVTDIVTAQSGDGGTCALLNDKTVKCWGFTSSSSGDTNFLIQPTDVGLTGVTLIAGGNNFNCAALSSGGAKCWGFGREGELGASVNYAWAPPVATGLSGTVSKLRASDYVGCALLSTGTLQCWGSNQFRQLGPLGGTDFDSFTPLTVTDVSSVKDVSVGAENVCVIDTSGGVQCWGDDRSAQLGDQNLGSMGSGAAVSIPLSGPAASVATGAQNACVVMQNGSVQCWGRSIGDLSSSATLVPTTVW